MLLADLKRTKRYTHYNIHLCDYVPSSSNLIYMRYVTNIRTTYLKHICALLQLLSHIALSSMAFKAATESSLCCVLMPRNHEHRSMEMENHQNCAALYIYIYIYVCCYCFRNKTKSQRGFFTTHYITAFVDIFLIYLWTHLYKQTAHKWIFVYINTIYWLCCIYFTHVELANTTNNDACYFFVHALA